MAEFTYNNKVHTGTKVLPFQANYGQDPRIGFKIRKKKKHKRVQKFVERIKKIQEEAKVALIKAQEDLKKYVDRHRLEVVVMNRLDPIKELYNMYSEKEDTLRIVELGDNRLDLVLDIEGPANPYMDL